MCLLTGPPDDIDDISISPDTRTACNFVVQWRTPFSHPVCGEIWYKVKITDSEGEELIITDSTTMTNYNVTGLSDNTVYHVTVTPCNEAGSGNAATETMTTDSMQVHFLCICNVTYILNSHIT